MQRRLSQPKAEPIVPQRTAAEKPGGAMLSRPEVKWDGNPFANHPLLRAVAVYSGSTRLAEMAAMMGFDAIWVEMEHGPIDFSQVELLCMAIERGGAIPIVRIPDLQRHHILRSLEVGGRIIVVPMINTPAQARELVAHGKFPPIGSRGYNVRSRGVGYGLGNKSELFARANAHTHLFAQIETMEAVENIDAICQVEGLAGIFIGPGDLSVSAGCMGELQNDRLIESVIHSIRRAHHYGKKSGILVPPGPMLDAAIQSGCNLVVVGGDVTELQGAWSQLLARMNPTADKPEGAAVKWNGHESEVSRAVAAVKR